MALRTFWRKWVFGFCFCGTMWCDENMRSVARAFSCPVFKYAVGIGIGWRNRKTLDGEANGKSSKPHMFSHFSVYLVCVCALCSMPYAPADMQPSSNKSVWQMLERQANVPNDDDDDEWNAKQKHNNFSNMNANKIAPNSCVVWSWAADSWMRGAEGVIAATSTRGWFLLVDKRMVFHFGTYVCIWIIELTSETVAAGAAARDCIDCVWPTNYEPMAIGGMSNVHCTIHAQHAKWICRQRREKNMWVFVEHQRAWAGLEPVSGFQTRTKCRSKQIGRRK